MGSDQLFTVQNLGLTGVVIAIIGILIVAFLVF